jgi:UDP-glucose 4-epimerase
VTVLVTGGAGFIGSHVVDLLCAGGYTPRIFDLVPPSWNSTHVESLVGDLLDPAVLARAMRGCDAVIHLAAVADVSEVVTDPARADLVNVRGTQFALEAALAAGVPRFVYASTVWVYGGANGNGNGRMLDEDTPLVLPKHFYTATKLAGEMYCRSYAELYGLEQTILRFGIPYGPRSRPAAVVAAFVARARAGEPLLINGDGSQSRQFVYVEDLAEGIVAATSESAPPGLYNLVGEESISVRTIADHVRELIADVPIVHVDGRRADVVTGLASAERAARHLNWRVRTPFREGIRAYVEWVTDTSVSPRLATTSTIAGSAATVLRQDPDEL